MTSESRELWDHHELLFQAPRKWGGVLLLESQPHLREQRGAEAPGVSRIHESLADHPRESVEERAQGPRAGGSVTVFAIQAACPGCARPPPSADAQNV